MAEAPSLVEQEEYLATNLISFVGTVAVLNFIVRRPVAKKALDWMVQVLVVLSCGLIARLVW